MRLISIFILMAYSSIAFSQEDSGKVHVDTIQFEDYRFEVSIGTELRTKERLRKKYFVKSTGDTIGFHEFGFRDVLNLLGHEYEFPVIPKCASVLAKDDSTIILYFNYHGSSFHVCNLKGEVVSERIILSASGGGANYEQPDGIYSWGGDWRDGKEPKVGKYSFRGEPIWESPLDTNYHAWFARFSSNSRYLQLTGKVSFGVSDMGEQIELILDTKTGKQMCSWESIIPGKVSGPLFKGFLNDGYFLTYDAFNKWRVQKLIEGVENPVFAMEGNGFGVSQPVGVFNNGNVAVVLGRDGFIQLLDTKNGKSKISKLEHANHFSRLMTVTGLNEVSFTSGGYPEYEKTVIRLLN